MEPTTDRSTARNQKSVYSNLQAIISALLVSVYSAVFIVACDHGTMTNADSFETDASVESEPADKAAWNYTPAKYLANLPDAEVDRLFKEFQAKHQGSLPWLKNRSDLAAHLKAGTKPGDYSTAGHNHIPSTTRSTKLSKDCDWSIAIAVITFIAGGANVMIEALSSVSIFNDAGVAEAAAEAVQNMSPKNKLLMTSLQGSTRFVTGKTTRAEQLQVFIHFATTVASTNFLLSFLTEAVRRSNTHWYDWVVDGLALTSSLAAVANPEVAAVRVVNAALTFAAFIKTSVVSVQAVFDDCGEALPAPTAPVGPILPDGDYQKTCNHCAMTGDGHLYCAECADCKSRVQPSGIDSDASGCDAVYNCDGKLSCKPCNSCQRETAWIYSAANYGGKSASLLPGKYETSKLSIGNDSLSCITVPSGFRVTLFDRGDFGVGPLMEVVGQAKVADLSIAPYQFNDVTSAILVENPPVPRVVIFEAANYKGKAKILQKGQYKMGSIGIGNDTLSSIRVDPPLKVELYTADGFAGTKKTVSGSISDLSSPTHAFNDTTSSIIVK